MSALRSPLVMKTGAVDLRRPDGSGQGLTAGAPGKKLIRSSKERTSPEWRENPVDKTVPGWRWVYPLIGAFEPVEQLMIYAPALRRRGASRWARSLSAVLA